METIELQSSFEAEMDELNEEEIVSYNCSLENPECCEACQ